MVLGTLGEYDYGFDCDYILELHFSLLQFVDAVGPVADDGSSTKMHERTDIEMRVLSCFVGDVRSDR